MIGLFIIVAILIFVLISSIIFLFRNEWVMKHRLEILLNKNNTLKESLDEFKTLASYNEMLYKFWIWDVEKFKK